MTTQSSLGVLVKRLADDESRPLLQEQNLTSKLTQLCQERESLYKQADIVISIAENDSVEDIVSEIIAKIPAKIIAQQES